MCTVKITSPLENIYTGWTPNLWTVHFDTPNSWWMIKIKKISIQKQILFILNDSRPLLLLKMTIFIQIIIFENIKYTWFFKKSDIYFFNDDKVKCLAILFRGKCHILLYTTNMEPFQWFERLFLVLPIFFKSISSPFCHDMKIPIKIKFCNISTNGRISQNIL